LVVDDRSLYIESCYRMYVKRELGTIYTYMLLLVAER